MDLSLLPTSESEYNKQRTGSRFTVRSANSPSYSLTRRPGVRKRETAEESGEREQHGTNTGTNGTKKEEDAVTEYQSRTGSRSNLKGQCEEKEALGYKMTAKLNQNDTADKTMPETGTDSENPAFEKRGRTAWKRGNLANRSKSLDWRTGERSLDRGTGADWYTLSTKRGADISKQASSLVERRTGVEGGMMGRVIHMSQNLERASRGNSLPSRLKPQSGPGSKLSDTAILFGLKGGQSIQERIQKLYGSSGLGKDFSIPETSTDSPWWRSYEKTAGGTFPRRFSTGDRISPVIKRIPSIWTQNDTKTSGSETSLPPLTSTTRVRSPGGQWQGQMWSRCSNEGVVTWRKGFIETGTRSLDRARSKYTVAAQIRAARAADGISTTQQPSNFHGETSFSFRDSSRLRERRGSESKIEYRTSFGEENSESVGINGTLTEIMESVKEQENENKIDSGAKEKTELNSHKTNEEAFETNPQKITLKTAERKKFPEMLSITSSASVRNKINQFEALTQSAQGVETNQFPVPRRTFSVPTQLSNSHGGVKKSGSSKDINELRKKWVDFKEEGEAGDEEKVMGTRKIAVSGKSLSVDEVGLRLEKKEAAGSDLVEEGKNSSSDDFIKYAQLKNTLVIPLNEGVQRGSRKFYIDETDFSKVSSPEEGTEGNTTATNTPSPQLWGETAAGEQEGTPAEITSPVSDDDKTPTNTPDHSPFMSPRTQLENATPSADSKNKSTFVFTEKTNSQDPDTPPLPGPLATSSPSNLPELICPDVNAALPKGKKYEMDLDAWVTGLNPEFKGWKYAEDDYEDDDESTQKDDDSNYDSDSGESSVTVTSNMSQDHRSFCVSLSDLCNFAGVDYESENDSDEWQSTGRRSASLSSDVSALSYVSVMPAEELDRLLEDVRRVGDNTLQDYNDVQVVVLHKEMGVGLGFSMAGGVDQNNPITVHKVFHSGVAAKEGSIRAGDRVLSINGTALQGCAHWEAVRVLRRAKAREMGVVVLRRGDITGPSKKEAQKKSQGPIQSQYETGQRVSVQVQKNSRDLGFSLEGGVDSIEGNRPLTVQKIFLGGPVDKVCSGDEILEIQGMSVVGMRRLEAWTLIRTLPPGPVDVVLRRPLKCLET